MKQNAMEREREAVDSEFQMALPSDDNRLYQVWRIFGVETGLVETDRLDWAGVVGIIPGNIT